MTNHDADTGTMKRELEHLHQGFPNRLRVTLANGNTGAVYVDDADPHYPDETHYIFYSDYWGCHEPICEVHDKFLTQDFLAGATITMTDSIYQQEEA